MAEGISQSVETPIQFPAIAAEIAEMARVDQEMRIKNLKEPDSWDPSIDARNTARMEEIINQIGWPTVSKVGKQPSSNAWLLVQHADRHPEFQIRCLELIKAESAGEVDARDIAMLEDRVRINTGRPQLYGTQFRSVNGEHKPLPIEDRANVEERRKAIGLDSLEENIRRMYESYGVPEQG